MDNKFLNTGFNSGFGGGLTGATVNDTVNNITKYQEETKRKYNNQKTQELENSAKTMCECALKSTDTKTQNMNTCGSNSAFMELIIKQAAQNAGSTAYDNLGEGEILCRYLQNNPSQIQNTVQVQKGLMSVAVRARKNGLEMVKGNTQSFEPIERKGKSFAGTLGKLVGAELGLRELIGWPMEGLGNYLENKTINKSSPEDVNREARSAKYNGLQDKYRAMLKDYNSELETLEARLYEATPEEAEQIKSQMNLVNARKASVEERLAELSETEKALPDGKPKTIRETIKEADVSGTDANAAGQMEQEADILYNTKIKPTLKLSKWEGDVGEILKSITKSDFGGMTEGQRKEMKKIIDKEAAAYSKKNGKVGLEELHKILDDFDLSKSSLKGEDTQGLYSQFKDVAHTKIRNLINEEGKIVDEAFGDNMMEYSNKRTGARQLRANATNEGGRRLNTSIKQDFKDRLGQSKYKRNWGKRLKRRGKAIRPTTNIMKIIEKIKNPGVTEKLVEKGQEIVSQPKLVESPTLTKISEQLQKSEEQIENIKNTINSTTKKSTRAKGSRKIANPREAIQSSLPGFGSPMDFVTVALGDIFEMGGLEMPLDVLTEIASYALESAKLGQPLYDKENSYVNQNPYKDISPLNRGEQASKYYEINGEDVPGYGKEAREAYEAEQWLQQQDWWKELLEEEAKNEKDYKERMDEEDIDIEALIDALN